MKKENAETIVDTILNIMNWTDKHGCTVQFDNKGRTKIIPEDKTYIIEFTLNKTETEIFLNHPRVVLVHENHFIIAQQKRIDSPKVTAKQPKQIGN
jgi:hypothetical protein